MVVHVVVFGRLFPSDPINFAYDSYFWFVLRVSSACAFAAFVICLLAAWKRKLSSLLFAVVLAACVTGGILGGQAAHLRATRPEMVSSFARRDYDRLRASFLRFTSDSKHRHPEYLQIFPESVPEYASDIIVHTRAGWGQGGTGLSLSYTVPEESWGDVERLFEKFGSISFDRVKRTGKGPHDYGFDPPIEGTGWYGPLTPDPEALSRLSGIQEYNSLGPARGEKRAYWEADTAIGGGLMRNHGNLWGIAANRQMRRVYFTYSIW